MKHYYVDISIVKFVTLRIRAKNDREAEAKAKKKVFAKRWKIGRKDIEDPNVIER